MSETDLNSRERSGWRTWFYRVAAAQFLITIGTGLALYFRPLEGREGLYSEPIKEWLVMLHNGEWMSELVMGTRYLSGLAIGIALSFLIVRFSWRALRRPPR